MACKDIHKLVAFCTLCPPQEHRSTFVERVPPEIPVLGAMRKLRGPGPRTSSQKTSPPKESMATSWSRKPDEVSSWWLAAEGPKTPLLAPSQAPPVLRGQGRGPLSSRQHLPPRAWALVRGPSASLSTGPRASVHGGPAAPRRSPTPTKQHFTGTSLSFW